MISFRYVYNYCTSVNHSSSRQGPSSSSLNSGSRKTQNANGTQLVGLELYKKLKQYLQGHIHNISKVLFCL